MDTYSFERGEGRSLEGKGGGNRKDFNPKSDLGGGKTLSILLGSKQGKGK